MPIDLSHLDQLFRGDRALRSEWIELYLKESPQYFDQLISGFDTGDATAMANAAHDLRPQAHYLGSAALNELLTAIEEAASTRGTAACFGPLRSVLDLREAINVELREVLERDRPDQNR